MLRKLRMDNTRRYHPRSRAPGAGARPLLLLLLLAACLVFWLVAGGPAAQTLRWPGGADASGAAQQSSRLSDLEMHVLAL